MLEFLILILILSQSKKASYLLDTNPFVDAFALIRQIALVGQNNAPTQATTTTTTTAQTTASSLVNIFYRAYALCNTLAERHGPTSRGDHAHTRSLLGHMLFSSSTFTTTLSSEVANVKPDKSKSNSKSSKPTQVLNIYKEASVAQVLLLKKRLDELVTRLDELLVEWADNPILLDIVKIKRRIDTFDLVHHPLMQYLTGVELLLERAERWEQVASKRHSLAVQLKCLNELVVSWRQLELKHWLASLDDELVAIERRSAHAHFFHLFDACFGLVQEGLDAELSSTQLHELMKTTKQLVEQSCLGDYAVRIDTLQICMRFFADIASSSSNSNKKALRRRCEQLVDALASLCAFFTSVHSGAVETAIGSKRALTQAELKSFVDIYKWQDANYWSLKQSTIKSTHTLFKVLRKYRNFLRQPVAFEAQASLAGKLPVDFFKRDKQLATQLRKLYELAIPQQSATTAAAYQRQMARYCRRLLRAKFMRNEFNESIDSFATSVYERYSQLANEEQSLAVAVAAEKQPKAKDQTTGKSISSSVVDKEAKKRRAKTLKSLNAQKCTLVSDLLKQLKHMGISYRHGAIRHASQLTRLDKLIMFPHHHHHHHHHSHHDADSSMPPHFAALFAQSEHAFYKCSAYYVWFRDSCSSTKNGQQQALAIPVQQLANYADHFYHVLHEQKWTIGELVAHAAEFDVCRRALDTIAAANEKRNQLSATHALDKKNTNKYASMETMSSTLEQINAFFAHVAASNQAVKASYEAIAPQLVQLNEQLDSAARRFASKQRLASNVYEQAVQRFASDSGVSSSSSSATQVLEGVRDHAAQVCAASAEHCQPFSAEFERIARQIDSLIAVENK